MRAAIFDMDGLLIDSEPLWRDAEIAVFESVGVKLTEAQCKETIGLRVDEAVAYWHAKQGWPGPSPALLTERLIDEAAKLIAERGRLMEGAEELIAELRDEKLQLAIASSSPLSLIHAVVDRFGLGRYFDILHSAEHEPAGKPDPAVYRTAMARLDAAPEHCLAFEDSLPGVRSAKAAGATVIAVPAADDASDAGFDIADMVLGSLREFSIESARSLRIGRDRT